MFSFAKTSDEVSAKYLHSLPSPPGKADSRWLGELSDLSERTAVAPGRSGQAAGATDLRRGAGQVALRGFEGLEGAADGVAHVEDVAQGGPQLDLRVPSHGRDVMVRNVGDAVRRRVVESPLRVRDSGLRHRHGALGGGLAR